MTIATRDHEGLNDSGRKRVPVPKRRCSFGSARRSSAIPRRRRDRLAVA